MKFNSIQKWLLCAIAVFSITLPVAAQRGRANLDQQVLATMKQATQFMMDEVSYNGGFVWNYLPDFSRQWGEMEAKRTMAWVQSPGTPGIGHLMLDVYHATGDEYYYEMAEKVTNALIWGQLDCGGWNYMFDFAGEASLKDWYATVGKSGWRLEEFQYYYGNATFDDAGTMEAANLLLRMYMEKLDPKFKPALDKVINFVLESQYPVGGWPQRYPLRYDFPKKGNPDYTSFITLNDDVAEENIDFLISCYQALGEQSLMEPIYRAMNCMRVLQQGVPQAGWGMQYNLLLEPEGARTYEPNGIVSHTTAACIAKMMDYYQLTGDTKFMLGIPAAIEFLESIKLSSADLAKFGRPVPEGMIACPTFIEIGTGVPRYIHRRGSNVFNGEYYYDQNLENVIGHYGSVRMIPIQALKDRYAELQKMPKEAAVKGSPLLETGLVELPKYFTRLRGRGDVDSTRAQELVSGLNSEGYWPTPLVSTSNPYIGPGDPNQVTPGNYVSTNVGDKYDTSPYRTDDPPMGISAGAYISNMFTLVQYLDSRK